MKQHEVLYPGHPVVLAYFITQVFPSLAEAEKHDKHGTICALSNSKIPGSSGCIYAALQLLDALLNSHLIPQEEAFKATNTTWGRYEDRPDHQAKGQAQAEAIKGDLLKALKNWKYPPYLPPSPCRKDRQDPQPH